MTGSFLACESRTHFAVRRIMSLPANPATPRDYFPLASQKKRGLCAVKKNCLFLSQSKNHSHVTRMAFLWTCLTGVPWNIHCWSQTVGHAYERAQKSFLRCLLRDFQSISADEYTNDFCDDGLAILFNIFRECEVRRACTACICICYNIDHGTGLTNIVQVDTLLYTSSLIKISHSGRSLSA